MQLLNQNFCFFDQIHSFLKQENLFKGTSSQYVTFRLRGRISVDDFLIEDLLDVVTAEDPRGDLEEADMFEEDVSLKDFSKFSYATYLFLRKFDDFLKCNSETNWHFVSENFVIDDGARDFCDTMNSCLSLRCGLHDSCFEILPYVSSKIRRSQQWKCILSCVRQCSLCLQVEVYKVSLLASEFSNFVRAFFIGHLNSLSSRSMK